MSTDIIRAHVNHHSAQGSPLMCLELIMQQPPKYVLHLRAPLIATSSVSAAIEHLIASQSKAKPSDVSVWLMDFECKVLLPQLHQQSTQRKPRMIFIQKSAEKRPTSPRTARTPERCPIQASIQRTPSGGGWTRGTGQMIGQTICSLCLIDRDFLPLELQHFRILARRSVCLASTRRYCLPKTAHLLGFPAAQLAARSACAF